MHSIIRVGEEGKEGTIPIGNFLHRRYSNIFDSVQIFALTHHRLLCEYTLTKVPFPISSMKTKAVPWFLISVCFTLCVYSSKDVGCKWESDKYMCSVVIPVMYSLSEELRSQNFCNFFSASEPGRYSVEKVWSGYCSWLYTFVFVAENSVYGQRKVTLSAGDPGSDCPESQRWLRIKVFSEGFFQNWAVVVAEIRI